MLDKSFSQIDVFQRALNVSWLNNSAISNNIANINTPGYKKEVVKFDSILQDKMAATQLTKTNAKHISANGLSGEPRIEKISNTTYRTDGNNVDIDVEMAELAKNQLKYEIVTKQLNSKLSRLKSAIDSGR